MRIHFYRSVTEAWGFAYHKFDLIARQGWFPVLLIILFSLVSPYLILSIVNGELVTIGSVSLKDAVAALNNPQNQQFLWSEHLGDMILFNLIAYVLVTLLYASFFVPLLQYTARGHMPSHRSVNLAVGPRHFKFLGASLLTIFVILLVLWSPMALSTFFIDQYVADAMNTQYASFPDPDSLHTIETVAKMDDPSGFQILKWTLHKISIIAILYFSLRFFAVPFFAGVREKSDSYNSLKASWQLTRGWNAARLGCAIFVIWIALMIVTWVLNLYALPLTKGALMAMYQLVVQSLGVMDLLNQEMRWIQDLLNWIWLVVLVLVNMIMIFLTFGLVAGLAGSLFHQAELDG